MSAYFKPEAPELKGPGPRAFCKCGTCKTRWVAETTQVTQLGRTVSSWLGKNGYEHAEDKHTYTRSSQRRLVKPECPKCGGSRIAWEGVKAQYREDVKCDARCTSAKGPNCSCSCGGQYHGAAA